MSPDRFERVQRLFEEAYEIPSGERGVFLERECGSDAGLRQEVEDLLGAALDSEGLFANASNAFDVLTNPADRTLPHAFEVGETLAGRFRIVRYIGRGGIGEVYEAEDFELGDRVALKTLRPEHMTDVVHLARFRREVNIARRVKHPNVCKVHDVGRHTLDRHDITFLTMELLGGKTLGDHLKTNGLFKPEEAVSIIRELAEGLQALHEKGIVHRDFKPGNVILVPERAGKLRPVITDFGLARSVHVEDRFATATVSGQIVGTPGYMAPEQMTGGEIGPWTDVYAFGVMLGTLLDEGREDSRACSETDGVGIPCLADDLRLVARRCTLHDYRERFDDINSLLEALDTALEDGSSPPPDEVALRPVVEVVAEPQTPSLATTTIGAAKPRLRNPLLAFALLALTALAIAIAPNAKPQLLGGLCSLFQGNTYFCVLPDDRDVAVAPFEITAQTPDGEALGRGLERHLFSTLYRLNADKSKHCLHFRTARGAYAATLLASGSIKVDEDEMYLTLVVRDSASGVMLRELSRAIPLSDLHTYTEMTLSEVATSVGLRLSRDFRSEWQSIGARNARALSEYMKGLGYSNVAGFEGGVDSPRAVEHFAAAMRANRGNITFAAAAVGLGNAYTALYRETEDPVWAKKAASAFRQAQTSRNYAPLHSGWGGLELLSDKEKAIERLRKAIDIDPFDAQGRVNLAAALAAEGNLTEADEVREEAVRLRPECWLVSNQLAGYYMHRGRYEDSERELLKTFRLSKGNSASLANLSRIYLKLGRYDDAIEVAGRSIEISENPQAFATMGRAYAYRDCPEQGIANLRSAVKRDPDSYVHWYSYGETLQGLGMNREEARSAFDRSVTLARQRLDTHAEDTVAWRVLAKALSWLGHEKEALEALSRLQSLSSKSRITYHTSAVVHVLGGAEQRAYEDLDHALAGGMTPYEIAHTPAFHDLVRSAQFRGLLESHRLDPTEDAGATTSGLDSPPCASTANVGRGFPSRSLSLEPRRIGEASEPLSETFAASSKFVARFSWCPRYQT